ncbi:hypothetical protein TNCV_2120241 [Trichonephila clavipes]|nr:hypothetical protein TNCV_2120241 [Trichonephila clavipes]
MEFYDHSVGHVQKRMDTRLMKLKLVYGKKKLSDGKTIGGEGRGSPVVKVSDHGRHVMSSSPVPLKTRSVGQRCTLNLSRAETSPVGVVW